MYQYLYFAQHKRVSNFGRIKTKVAYNVLTILYKIWEAHNLLSKKKRCDRLWWKRFMTNLKDKHLTY